MCGSKAWTCVFRLGIHLFHQRLLIIKKLQLVFERFKKIFPRVFLPDKKTSSHINFFVFIYKNKTSNFIGLQKY